MNCTIYSTLGDFNAWKLSLNGEELQFKGYIWLSDQENPRMIGNLGELEELNKASYQFIYEGFLYNEKSKKSIKIISPDGLIRIFIFDLNSLSKDSKFRMNPFELVANQKHFPNRKMKFIRIHELSIDSITKFSNYLFKGEIFIGFEKIENG